MKNSEERHISTAINALLGEGRRRGSSKSSPIDASEIGEQLNRFLCSVRFRGVKVQDANVYSEDFGVEVVAIELTNGQQFTVTVEDMSGGERGYR